MKKIILAAFAIIGFSAASFAQSTQKVTEPLQKKEHKMVQPAKTVAAKSQTNMTSAPASGVAQKKQMTPVAAAGPAKKDGTPDMRYKSNKTAVATTSPKHLKKDGTPDKRYTETKKKS